MITDRFGASALTGDDSSNDEISTTSSINDGYLSFGEDALYDDPSITFGSGSTEESIGGDPSDESTDTTDAFNNAIDAVRDGALDPDDLEDDPQLGGQYDAEAVRNSPLVVAAGSGDSSIPSWVYGAGGAAVAAVLAIALGSRGDSEGDDG